ncbi:arylsulfatase [Chitinophaga pendula]|uniref:arylsulfatase n=1 Tax=Chitinophaga TaxID=79328 RepID=UPI000BAE6C91|nr:MULTISPECIES: arylsulfatase [Chitinophaga]ASZ14102.1 sulfatase [Chitinophaga sp. MD30]UCJ08266.1 arylsulfatase [Chitinophaga pendula]
MRTIILTLALLSCWYTGSAQQKRPNIILIMVDDMGFSDIGPYGSEISTPHLDRLATEGLKLREFYNNSICAPTRASLLTGQSNHKAGIGYFNVNLGLPAYQGYLNRESLTLAEVLKAAGYSTLMSGKWHVGDDSTAWPRQRGFDRFFGFIGGASNYYDIGDYQDKVPPVPLLEDNRRVNLQPGHYLTDEIAAHAVQFLDEQNHTSKPFFLYVAYNAPHWPLQARPEDIAKYKGRYSIGWDSLRQQRITRQKQLGIIPANATVAPDPEVPAWAGLTYDEQKLWEKKMEVYAAMIDRMDQGIGTILDKLKALKKDDNTLIVFLSDNGAQGGFIPTGRPRQRNSGPIGTAGSYDYQEQSWAHVSNTPLRSYKASAYEGGISSPLIAWLPARIKAGTTARGIAHLIDLAPTFYDIAGVKYPTQYEGHSTHPLQGISLASLFFNQQEPVRPTPLCWERAGNKAVRQGKWKLVASFNTKQWELYDIDNDRAETNNLATAQPAVVQSLSDAYERWAKENGVVDYEKIKPTGAAGFAGPTANAGETPAARKQR